MSAMLIKNGTVVDGTGAPAFAADVRVVGGTIAEVGPNLAARAGERVFDAAGCYVTPGFIESHTHYDASMWWDSKLDPLPGGSLHMYDIALFWANLRDDAAGRVEVFLQRRKSS